jgi:hypothetical protein
VTNDLRQLKMLSLNGNDDLVLTGTDFTHLGQLKHLDLSFVPLPVDINYLAGLERSLEALVLQFCELDEVPSTRLQQLRVLRHVDLSENVIQELREEDFMGITATEWLLVNNGVEFVDDWAFLDVDKPLMLDLRLNLIQESELGFLETSCVAGQVKLNGNPLVCDCRLWRSTRRWNIHVVGTCTGQQGTELEIGGTQFQIEMANRCQNYTSSNECNYQWVDKASDGWLISSDYITLLIQLHFFMLLVVTM